VAKKGKKDVPAEEAPELEDDVVVLLDEEGKESKFKILFSSLFVGEKQYVVLMPLDQEDSAEPEIVILRVDSTEGGEGVLSTIDDDDEWEEVLQAFEETDVEQNLGDYEVEIPEDPKK
jgi:uncharacterized protein YrzB (UPF0473 family)